MHHRFFCIFIFCLNLGLKNGLIRRIILNIFYNIDVGDIIRSIFDVLYEDLLCLCELVRVKGSVIGVEVPLDRGRGEEELCLTNRSLRINALRCLSLNCFECGSNIKF